MHALPHILVFDSGAGGLSVAREILAKTPSCRLTYAADNAAFPYGLLSDGALIERVCQQIEMHITRFQPDIIVIACNTASTLALERLREIFSVPFVGVVPAIKPAARLTRSGVIGLLATPATVNRDYTFALIRQFAADVTVKLYGSNKLVTLAEDTVMGIPPEPGLLLAEIDALFSQEQGNEIDTVVLACTHFPLLAEQLRALPVGRQVRWIDSGEAIARRVEFLIEELGPPHAGKDAVTPAIDIVLSDPGKAKANMYEAYRRILLEK